MLLAEIFKEKEFKSIKVITPRLDRCPSAWAVNSQPQRKILLKKYYRNVNTKKLLDYKIKKYLYSSKNITYGSSSTTTWFSSLPKIWHVNCSTNRGVSRTRLHKRIIMTVQDKIPYPYRPIVNNCCQHTEVRLRLCSVNNP